MPESKSFGEMRLLGRRYPVDEALVKLVFQGERDRPCCSLYIEARSQTLDEAVFRIDYMPVAKVDRLQDLCGGHIHFEDNSECLPDDTLGSDPNELVESSGWFFGDEDDDIWLFEGMDISITDAGNERFRIAGECVLYNLGTCEEEVVGTVDFVADGVEDVSALGNIGAYDGAEVGAADFTAAAVKDRSTAGIASEQGRAVQLGSVTVLGRTYPVAKTALVLSSGVGGNRYKEVSIHIDAFRFGGGYLKLHRLQLATPVKQKELGNACIDVENGRILDGNTLGCSNVEPDNSGWGFEGYYSDSPDYSDYWCFRRVRVEFLKVKGGRFNLKLACALRNSQTAQEQNGAADIIVNAETEHEEWEGVRSSHLQNLRAFAGESGLLSREKTVCPEHVIEKEIDYYYGLAQTGSGDVAEGLETDETFASKVRVFTNALLQVLAAEISEGGDEILEANRALIDLLEKNLLEESRNHVQTAVLVDELLRIGSCRIAVACNSWATLATMGTKLYESLVGKMGSKARVDEAGRLLASLRFAERKWNV
ncbi:MAG: hypothetical protein ACYTBJ_12130 [Planctomycetota bacterium]|jgi:hypothetical protein